MIFFSDMKLYFIWSLIDSKKWENKSDVVDLAEEGEEEAWAETVHGGRPVNSVFLSPERLIERVVLLNIQNRENNHFKIS